ncbi:hypothetical protein L3V82_03160 [Thiotrichales bacterium 19S3-7]|nr:hypothetical protein [Thiotrichales bacterium 19S3-7]MCF6801169.1 hypothetical protein [Thiotrichales bacterium 19S3-11]
MLALSQSVARQINEFKAILEVELDRTDLDEKKRNNYAQCINVIDNFEKNLCLKVEVTSKTIQLKETKSRYERMLRQKDLYKLTDEQCHDIKLKLETTKVQLQENSKELSKVTSKLSLSMQSMYKLSPPGKVSLGLQKLFSSRIEDISENAIDKKSTTKPKTSQAQVTISTSSTTDSSSVKISQPKHEELTLDEPTFTVNSNSKEKAEAEPQQLSVTNAVEAFNNALKQADFGKVLCSACEASLNQFKSDRENGYLRYLPGSEYDQRVETIITFIKQLSASLTDSATVTVESNSALLQEAFDNGSHWNQKGWFHYDSYNILLMNCLLQKLNKSHQDYSDIAYDTYMQLYPPKAVIPDTPLFDADKVSSLKDASLTMEN